jgi:acyl carrier protein
MAAHSNENVEESEAGTMTIKSIAQTDHGVCSYNFAGYRPEHLEPALDIKPEILSLLDEILSLNGRAATFKEDTALLGVLPELDSMAVVALITGMEERFGITVDDDEIDGATFATVGSLIEFIQAKLAA